MSNSRIAAIGFIVGMAAIGFLDTVVGPGKDGKYILAVIFAASAVAYFGDRNRRP